MQLALSVDNSGKTEKLLEAVPLPIDVAVERTFENRERYNALLVEAAVEELSQN